MARKAAAPAAPTEAAGCCPFQQAIDLLSKRHAMTIIWLLQQHEPRRFNELKRALDVNPVTLTLRLSELDEAGVITRRTYNTSPPRVEYSLTGKGHALVPLMDQLSDWAFRFDEAPASPAEAAPQPA